MITDQVITTLSEAMTAGFGGRIEVIPRLFLRAWVDLLDRADQHDDFDPMAFLQERQMVSVARNELTDVEREHWDQAHDVEI